MTPANDELEADIDRLYGLPLDQFTTARDELARTLRREGQREASAEVKRLRKPSLPAWALQVRRRHQDRADELIRTGGRLQKAQQRLVAIPHCGKTAVRQRELLSLSRVYPRCRRVC